MRRRQAEGHLQEIGIVGHKPERYCAGTERRDAEQGEIPLTQQPRRQHGFGCPAFDERGQQQAKTRGKGKEQTFGRREASEDAGTVGPYHQDRDGQRDGDRTGEVDDRAAPGYMSRQIFKEAQNAQAGQRKRGEEDRAPARRGGQIAAECWPHERSDDEDEAQVALEPGASTGARTGRH